MYSLRIKTHFDAAHYLEDYTGKCQRLHGHRWDVEVCLEGKKLSDPGNMLIDFGILKQLVHERLENLDHYLLNAQLEEPNVTAEYLAKWLFDGIWADLTQLSDEPIGVMLSSVCVWESPDCCVKYSSNMGSINDV